MGNKKTLGLGLMFLIVVAFSFLMYYGFSSADKTDIQNCRFIFIIVSECLMFGVMFLSTTGMVQPSSAVGLNFLAGGYFTLSLVINFLLGFIFGTVRSLIVVNVAVILIFLFILAMDMLSKRN